MKSIKLFAVISFIIITLSSSFYFPQAKFKSITLQAGTNTSTVLLKQTSQIISDRLKVYGLKSYELTIIGEKGQIRVQLPDSTSLVEIEGLLTSRGGLAFVDIEGKQLLSRSDIEAITSSWDKENGQKIEIKFLPNAKKVWANATRVNLNKPISIVIGNKVFYTPVVKTTIENGLCEITGNMTQKEVNYFLALVNNDKLPVDLKLLK
jgi:preprotein translocase subunit SecD